MKNALWIGLGIIGAAMLLPLLQRGPIVIQGGGGYMPAPGGQTAADKARGWIDVVFGAAQGVLGIVGAAMDMAGSGSAGGSSDSDGGADIDNWEKGSEWKT